jgi:hypothetical protein
MLFDAELTAVDVKPRRPDSDRVRALVCARDSLRGRRATTVKLGLPAFSVASLITFLVPEIRYQSFSSLARYLSQ